MADNDNKAQKESKPKVEKAKKVDINNLPKAEFVEYRKQKWEELKQKYAAQKENVGADIKITLPNGSVKEGKAHETTPLDIALSISKSLAESSVVAKVNGEVWDLSRPLEGDCSMELLNFESEEGKNVFWHSSAHILGQAMERLYHCNLCTGPPIKDGGFFYEAQMEHSVSDKDFDVLNSLVDNIVKEKQVFERLVVSKEEALELFKFNKYKTEILSKKVPEGGHCSVYRCGDLIDPCRGPHLPNTARVKAFTVTKNSSSYWQANAENDSLQRIYAITFPDTKQLKEWQKFQEEAAKRDHRLIGKNQDLWFFHNLSPGSCFFLPHGARIYNKLVEFMRRQYRQRGYDEVVTPNIFNTHLWETSGHWQNYQENMFSFKCEDQIFALKPMNCPSHCIMYGIRPRSYRELPLRLADFGVLHRNEFSGALSGMTRVRRFQQDDAHIFCTQEQIKNEITAVLAFMQYVYKIFGFTFTLNLSTRPEKFLGDIEVWNFAEKQLEEVLNEVGIPWKLNPGDGAFYGPKIDITIEDALKRKHQCATIQLDFQLPIRFDLHYTSEKSEGDREPRPVIVHRAIFGSVERFLAITTEHFGGKWPFWLSPRQCIVVPVHEQFNDYATTLCQQIQQAGFYCDVDVTDKKMQKKIRESQLAQYNFILVVGAEEQQANGVNVRTRDNHVHGLKTMTDLLAWFNELSETFQ